VRGEGAIAITVYGTPGPQGSKSFKGVRASKSGHATPILVESSAKVGPWRDAVEAAALIAMNQPRRKPLAGPLAASMVFSLQPPARIPRDRFVDGVPYPAAYPDTSKLVRSTEDALTGVVWLDDAQVVRYALTEKLYAGFPGALRRPGAVIRVWRIGGAM
jgi:Holliday junction resolvase RusA-like endonuclease